MNFANILIAILGFTVGVLWGFNLHIAVTRRRIRKGNPPKWIEDATIKNK